MELLERHVWLYTQGHESIRITRNVRGMVLVVCGPGPTRETHTFKNAAALNDFVEGYVRRLETDGWVLHATVDRRLDREANFPPSADRRRRAAAE